MKLKKLLLTVCSVITIGGPPITAYSDTQSAMAGHGWPNHFDTCFASSFAKMTNTCAGGEGSQRQLIIPIQLFVKPPPFSFTAFAYAGGNGSDGMTNCQAITVGSNNAALAFSNRVSSSTSSAAQTLSLGAVLAVLPTSTMHYDCRVAEGGGSVTSVYFL